jgi:hypothetical protein
MIKDVVTHKLRLKLKNEISLDSRQLILKWHS